MTASTPLSKANNLIDSLNEMLFNGVNNDLLEEIVADANKMKEIGQFTEAYNVLGMVAATRGNAVEVDRLFNAAIRSGGREPWTLGNYAAALNNLDRRAASVRIIDEVVELAPDNPSVVKEAINLHYEAYDVDGARELIAHCASLGQPINDPKMEHKLEMIETLMREHNATWTEMASRIEIAAGALHDIGLFPRLGRETIEDGILMHEFKIDGDVEMAFRAESAMNDAIAGKPYSRVDEFMYFSCSNI